MKPEVAVKLKPENERSYQKLIASIEASEGILSLLIAVCDDSNLREQLIQRYEAELQPDIRPYRLKLERDEPSLRAVIAKLVKTDEYLREGGSAVLTVTGTEELLFFSSKSEQSELDKFFGYLQWTREGLREFPYPIVLWVTNQIMVSLSEKAPDFWSWRSGVFRFVPENITVNISPVAVQPSPPVEHEIDDSLPLEDLQELIAKTEQQRGTKDPTLATLYDRMGQIYRSRIKRGEAEDYPKERELAIRCFSKAIELKTELGFKLGLVDSLTRLGNFYYFQSQYQQVINCYQQSLEIARDIGDYDGEAISLGGLGNAYYSLGRYQQAINFYQQSLEIKRGIGNRFGEAASLGSLGNAYHSLGQYQQAISLYQQSLEIARDISDRRGEAASLGSLGNAYYSLGQYQQAINFYQQSLEIARDIGNRRGEAASLGNLGNAYYSLGQYQQAINFYQQQLEIARDIGDRRGEAASLGNLGNAYYSLGQYQQASSIYQQSLEIARDIGDRHGEAIAWFNLGNTLAKLDRKWEALQAYQNARFLYQAMGLTHKVEDCNNAIEM